MPHPTDDLQYIASFQSNDSFTVIAQSPPFTVPATVNRPTRREQMLDPHAVEVITALTSPASRATLSCH
jgi:hypothetical protein